MAKIGSFGAAVRDADPNYEPDTFDFYGETFTVAERVGAMPLLRFASVADSGVDADEMAGLAAMHELLRDCLAEGDWPRFQRTAALNKADAEELMGVCSAVYQAVTARPTKQLAASSVGLPETGENLKVPSSSGESSMLTFGPEPEVSPIMRDPRVLALVPVSEAGKLLVG